MEAVVVLGDQLFLETGLFTDKTRLCFMAEDYGLCTHYRYHKHKLILFLAAMRHYRDYLEQVLGVSVSYVELTDKTRSLSYEEKLEQFVRKKKVTRLVLYEVHDRFFRDRIHQFATTCGIEIEEVRSPMFLVSLGDFEDYLKRHKKPFMKTFYEEQRRKTRFLMTASGEPKGGKYSFDGENRKKLPKGAELPVMKDPKNTHHTEQVKTLVDELFPSHPGASKTFWLPVTHQDADLWLSLFLQERFEHFGDYEDAISRRSDFLYHSALSPFLNCGLLTPQRVLTSAMAFARDIPLNSREGFLRQILGWREFIRGIDHCFGGKQENSNFWNHHRLLRECWYNAETGIPPLDDAIRKAIRIGYNHHIERLMIVSNIMLLTEVSPQEVYKWFMEMYVDSADWVMVPNVYGMGQWSDGGVFATKPYICGSNYIRKMSDDYGKGNWCDELDGLYWRFIERHSEFFLTNHRTRMAVSTLGKMGADKKSRLLKAAACCQERITTCMNTDCR